MAQNFATENKVDKVVTESRLEACRLHRATIRLKLRLVSTIGSNRLDINSTLTCGKGTVVLHL